MGKGLILRMCVLTLSISNGVKGNIFKHEATTKKLLEKSILRMLR